VILWRLIATLLTTSESVGHYEADSHDRSACGLFLCVCIFERPIRAGHPALKYPVLKHWICNLMVKMNLSIISKPFILIDRKTHTGKSKVQFTPNLINFHVLVCMHIDARTYTHSTCTIAGSTDLNIVRNDSSKVRFSTAFGPTKYTLLLLRRGKQR